MADNTITETLEYKAAEKVKARKKARNKEYYKRYYAAHREEMKARSREWAKLHRGEAAARSSRRRQRHPEQNREYKKQWNKRHPEQAKAWMKAHPDKIKTYGKRWRERHREEAIENQKRWNKANSEKCAAAAHARRARKRGAPGRFTAEQIFALYKQQHGHCANLACKKKLRKDLKGVHRDHRVPLSKGGTNHIDNIDLLCAQCNRHKSAKSQDVWARENGLLF